MRASDLPHQCLRRWCRVCTREMIFAFRAVDDTRSYAFFCTGCGVLVQIFEDMTPRLRLLRRLAGCRLEPFAREEEGGKEYSRNSWLLHENIRARRMRPRIMESKLGPGECLKRRCMICEKGMDIEYRFDHERRQYTFSCARCGTTVRLYEEIMKRMRNSDLHDGAALESLAENEEKLQNSWWITRAAWKIYDGVKILAKSKTGRLGKSALSDDEAEKLR